MQLCLSWRPQTDRMILDNMELIFGGKVEQNKTKTATLKTMANHDENTVADSFDTSNQKQRKEKRNLIHAET